MNCVDLSKMKDWRPDGRKVVLKASDELNHVSAHGHICCVHFQVDTYLDLYNTMILR